MDSKRWMRMCAGYLMAALALSGTAAAAAQQVVVDAALSSPVVLAGDKQTAYLRVAMTGSRMDDRQRPPVNIALVLDKSGSMSGEKIIKAREAALMAVNRLRSSDIVSLVAYDDTVQVLVPATKLGDSVALRAAIERIEAGGSTALFAGVSKGAYEVRKFLGPDRVNRIVLLSDGLANVGPSSPGELAELGASLGCEGIAVTTIGLGLGYNEDLMTRLAQRSDGNHMFAEEASDLRLAFEREFGEVLSVVAKEVTVRIDCSEGVRPVRLLGREGDVAGQQAVVSLNQVYSDQTKYALLEMELPAREAGTEIHAATVRVSYASMASGATNQWAGHLSASYTDSPALVQEAVNKDVMASAVHQIAVERNRLALRLRDEGDVGKARALLEQNWGYLRDNAARLNNEQLLDYGYSNQAAIENLDEKNWTRQRKVMREEQFQIMQQQAN